MSPPEIITESRIRELAEAWYQKLDEHVPMVELLPMLANENLEMRFPEGTVRGHAGFEGWYQRVIRLFFDEMHVVNEVTASISPDAPESAEVNLVVNWQARRWNPPAAKSEWLGFDAYQRWVVEQTPQTGELVIRTYIVDELVPMEGSAAL